MVNKRAARGLTQLFMSGPPIKTPVLHSRLEPYLVSRITRWIGQLQCSKMRPEPLTCLPSNQSLLQQLAQHQEKQQSTFPFFHLDRT